MNFVLGLRGNANGGIGVGSLFGRHADTFPLLASCFSTLNDVNRIIQSSNRGLVACSSTFSSCWTAFCTCKRLILRGGDSKKDMGLFHSDIMKIGLLDMLSLQGADDVVSLGDSEEMQSNWSWVRSHHLVGRLIAPL